MVAWLIGISFFFYSFSLLAAEKTPLFLSEALQLAEKQNPRIDAARAMLSAADHRIVQAKSGFLPQVNFTEAFMHTTNPMWAFGTQLNQERITQQNMDINSLNHPDPVSNFNSALSVEWLVYQGGQTQIGLNQAQLDRDSQELLLSRTRQEVVAQAATSYIGLLLTYHHLDVILKSLETAREHLKMIQSRYDNGLLVKSDLLRTEVHIAELEQERIQAESQIAIAGATLNAALGVTGGSNWQLNTPLEKGDPTSMPVEEWIDMAQSHRPDMQYVLLQERLAEAEIQKSKAARLSRVNLIGSYEVNTPDFRDSGDNYTVGAVMQLNLFNGDRTSAKIQEAESMLSRAHAMRLDMLSGIEVQTREAFLLALSAWDRIQVASTAVSLADEDLRIVRDRYENGLLTIVSLLDAEVAFQYAQVNQYKSLHDYTAARIRLALAAGTLDTDFR